MASDYLKLGKTSSDRFRQKMVDTLDQDRSRIQEAERSVIPTNSGEGGYKLQIGGGIEGGDP